MEPLLKDPGLDSGEGEGEGQGIDPAQEESPDQSISSAMPIEADAPMIQDGDLVFLLLILYKKLQAKKS